MMTPEMGVWLQRQGIERLPIGAGKQIHAHLVESHIRLLRNTMHHLDEEARQAGLEIPVAELALLSNMAKNSIAEYGGFSPTQTLHGSFPTNWSRAEVRESPEERMQDSLYKRALAQRAVQMAIY